MRALASWENLGGILKEEIRKKSFPTKAELTQNVISIWHNSLKIKEACMSLSRSVPEPVWALYNAKGHQTKYYILINKDFTF